MAKYMATESYKGLKDTDNFMSKGSPKKHFRLMGGHSIELNSVPKGLNKHLKQLGKKEK